MIILCLDMFGLPDGNYTDRLELMDDCFLPAKFIKSE